jgi:hypothetical protein
VDDEVCSGVRWSGNRRCQDFKYKWTDNQSHRQGAAAKDVLYHAPVTAFWSGPGKCRRCFSLCDRLSALAPAQPGMERCPTYQRYGLQHIFVEVTARASSSEPCAVLSAPHRFIPAGAA